MPNSSENSTQNLPCTNTYTSHATAWSSPVAPGAMPEPSSCIGRVNHSTFIRKMPSSAKPRIASSARMRRGASIGANARSEEHTSELQSLMRISYAVFCLKKKNKTQQHMTHNDKHVQT